MTPLQRMVVLGGSSPFTAGLIDSLADSPAGLDPAELVLHGRNEDLLALVAGYAQQRLAPLGWRVLRETDVARAVTDAGLVVHQIRYGGMEGRGEDESVARRFDLPVDETLGPAALNTLLRIREPLRDTAAILARRCPRAWVLNLTNPLSTTTTLMHDAGIRHCVGVCELPRVTARRAAETLELPVDEVTWRYRGLNHRGFLVELRQRDESLIRALVERLGHRSFEGVAADEIAELGVVPTKYFPLVRQRSATRPGRAKTLTALRERIAAELRAAPGESPPALRERYMAWYPESVVPLLQALRSAEPSEQIVNVTDSGGLTRELHARVDRGAVTPQDEPSVRGEAADWIDRFERHERALVDLVRAPSVDRLEIALERDPTVDASKAAALARFLATEHGIADRSGRP
ncbi:MAG: 6-phospho-beta-glucosidase [bacterium]|nr:6-phospho-beta-glucosidase [bacterium]